MVINITDTLILHVLKSNYKTNFTIFLFIFAFLKIDFFSTFKKPFLASVCCGVAALLTHKAWCAVLPESRFSALPAVFLGALIYVVFLLIARGICEEDIKALPNGEKITKRLEKYLQKTGG